MDDIDAIFQRELQTFPVALRKGADAKVNPRQVQSFARAQFAAHFHDADCVRSVHAAHFELNVTVVERE